MDVTGHVDQLMHTEGGYGDWRLEGREKDVDKTPANVAS